MPRYTRERITTPIKRWRVKERDPEPVVGFHPSAVLSAFDYNQWSILDGSATVQDGQAYVMRSPGETRFIVRLTLDAPAPSGCQVGFVTTDSTADSNHYSLVDSSPVTVPQGSTSFDVRIDPAQAGKWYEEKLLKLTLDQGTCANCTVDPDSAEFRVWLRPSVAVPTVEWASASASGGAGAQSLTVNLSAASLEDTKVYYNLGGTIDGADYTITSGDESGSLTIPAGSTSASLDFTIGGGATSGETLTFDLEHESSTVAYTAGLEDIHADENLLHHTDQWDLDVGAYGVGRQWPSDPTAWVTGGLDKDQSTDGYGTFLEMVDQGDVTDPAGEAVQGVVISQFHDSNSGTGYLRNGFEDQVRCGGPVSLFVAKKYVRLALRVEDFAGSDLYRNSRFTKVTIRNRAKVFEHSIVIDRQSTGLDKDGNATTTWTVGGDTWGLWDTSNLHPTKTTYGVTDQVFSGEGATKSSGTTVHTIWMCHEVDETYDYGGKKDEVGDFFVPIFRPVQASQDDGTADAWGNPIGNKGKGAIAFWPWFEMSDTGPYMGPPSSFWHKRGRWWEPRGSAALVDAGTNLHTFSVT